MRPNVFGYGTELVLSPKINPKFGRVLGNRRLDTNVKHIDTVIVKCAVKELVIVIVKY